MNSSGVLTISLDFELYWGMRDLESLDDCRRRLSKIGPAITGILRLFQEYEIHATWATVGMLFAHNRAELLKAVPGIKPDYVDTRLSPYRDISGIGVDENEEPCCYAPSLIQEICATAHQELGTHTFSHYYCLEEGQSRESFKSDLCAARVIGAQRGVEPLSIVFPRNQVNPDYLSTCSEQGILCYRGPSPHSIYAPRKRSGESLFRKLCRAADTFTGIFRYHSLPLKSLLRQEVPFNFPGTSHLRPALMRNPVLERLAVRRICKGLNYAARHGHVYHLWFHPEDFAVNPAASLPSLEKILRYFSRLRQEGRMESLNMRELAHLAINQEDGSVRALQTAFALTACKS